MFLHELPDVKELFLVVSDEKAIHPSIIEKIIGSCMPSGAYNNKDLNLN